MKCQECEKFLEEYFDGELGARESSTVEAHLAACSLCAQGRDALLAEASLYASYERGVEVSPRLWDGVEARILREAPGREAGLLRRVSARLAPLFTAPRFSPALTAALVLVAVGLTVGVMKLTGPRVRQPTQMPAQMAETGAHDQPRVSPAAAETPRPALATSGAAADTSSAANSATPGTKAQPENRKAPAAEQRRRANETPGGGQILTASNAAPTPGREATPDQLVSEAEQRYIAAILMLQRDVASRRSRLDAQTAARFDETLAAIDRSIGETRRTVRQHGSDPVAVQYMLSAYAKKVEVLREMAHVEQ
jgi:hypothetical protein